ncbi:EsaB/YukD family protein [Kitasatospora sp. NPDC059408]|uniref:EsaB/YukD family protein n=1 Tax=Kitasatospora sp. NPDC059408 TaxID=3346823 RepID=UPI0036C19852
MTATLTAISPAHAVRELTVVGPEGLVELAVPVTVPVVGLIPALVRCVAGSQAGDGDWALRRLGGAPLEPGDTAVSLGLRDGEVLHLFCSAVVG